MGTLREALRRNKSVLVGAAGATALLALFFGILTWGNSLSHAFEQFAAIWFWVLILAAGFGTQLGLYSHVRVHVRQRLTGATAEVAAAGGVSTGSMIACCAHYITNVLPLMGVSAAAVFLVKYQTPFILLGVFSNLTGVTFMLYFMQKHGLMPQLVRSQALSKCNMKVVRNVMLVFSLLAVSFSFLFVAFR